MKSLFLSTAMLLLLAATLTGVHAESKMETAMKQMSADAKQLKTDLALTDDTKHAKDADLKSVADLKAGALKSHDFTPAKENSLPPDQKEAMTASFQKDMEAFAKDIDTLSADIQGDKWDAARVDFQKVLDDEKNGHKAYRVKK